MTPTELDQFKSIVRAKNFASYSVFVSHMYDKNEDVMRYVWNHQNALAKSDKIVPSEWLLAGWNIAKISIYLDRAVSYFETYNNALIINMGTEYLLGGIETLLNHFSEALSELESFEYKYHYDNAIAVAQPVLNELHRIKHLLTTTSA